MGGKERPAHRQEPVRLDSLLQRPPVCRLGVVPERGYIHIDRGYTPKRHSSISVKPLQDRLVGIKMIAYNVDHGVKLELWVDDRADNNWVKIAETVDSGGWSSRIEYCGREPDHVISEPRPRVVFRVDNVTFEFENLSVREIEIKCYSGAIPFCA